MIAAASLGRQRGRPKVRSVSSHSPPQPVSFRLPPPGGPSCSLPSCHPDLGVPFPIPNHISVLRLLLLGAPSPGAPRDGAWGGILCTPSLEWAPMGSSIAPGIRTGKCVAFNDTVQTCEIFGWCPVEVDDDIPRPALLREAENFTLFIKNSISFPRFKVKRRNLVEVVDAAYMKTCLYHKTLHPLCPVFKLGYVIQESGQNFSTLAEKGGVVGITIDWNCDLDWHVRHCKPIYEFHGLYEEKNLSPGFNFRCLPGPTSAPFLGGPQALPLPEPLEAKQVSLGGEQRSPGSSQSPGIGQAGSLRGTRPWRPEPLLLALGPLEAHLARTRWGNC
uniref:Purinergic receptor P2X 1 n=1 Tax=Equus asinus asinus TaxID=83772 RepID=A0A8C4M043_EQUAS